MSHNNDNNSINNSINNSNTAPHVNANALHDSLSMTIFSLQMYQYQRMRFQ